MRRIDQWSPWAHDFRCAVRRLRRDSVFTLLAVAVLALGIGANTAVFSIVHSVLLRPLAYADSERLVALEEVVPQLSHIAPVLPVNARHFLDWKRNARTLEDLALIDRSEMNLTGVGDPERIDASVVTANLFDVLRVPVALGRTFTPDESRESVAVISTALWQRRFGAAPDVVGTTIALDGARYTVIGVLGAGFRDPAAQRVDVYVPWDLNEADWGWAGDHNFESVGRMREGASTREVVAELNLLQSRIATRFEGTGKLDLFVRVSPLLEHVVTTSRRALWTLMGAVCVVLLIACLNLGNLMLARLLARGRELAIRTALGASVRDVVRGGLVEGFLLATAGTVFGLGLAALAIRAFQLWPPAGLPRASEVCLDLTALLFAVAASFVTTAVFATVPAWRSARSDPRVALAGGRSASAGRESLLLRKLLVAGEVGLSVALLVVAGLLVRSSLRLSRVERGYQAADVITAEVTLPDSRYHDAESRRQFYGQVLASLREQPAVAAAGVVSRLPLLGHRWTDVVTAEGDVRPLAERPMMDYRPATPQYFRAMGIPLLAGRAMQDSDHPRLLAVLSARAAEYVWPGEDAIGKRFRRSDPDSPVFEVVGIVGDVRVSGLEEQPAPIVYVPLWARVPATASFAVRGRGDAASAVALLRRAVAEVDRQVPLADVSSMAAIERQRSAPRRFLMQLVGAFAITALLIASLGTYSVLAWSAGRRRAEIGIRMALGAGASHVRTMVLRQGLEPVAWGLVGGVLCAALSGPLLSSLLFQVAAHDLATYGLVIAVTSATALAACWLPARRATGVAPLQALRCE